MTYVTIEAEIADGRVIPTEAGRLAPRCSRRFGLRLTEDAIDDELAEL